MKAFSLAPNAALVTGSPSCTVTMLLGYGASLFTRPPEAKQLKGLTWSERPTHNESTP